MVPESIGTGASLTSSLPGSSTRIATLSPGEFAAQFGNPDLAGALCGFTREVDTRAILTLVGHARPRRLLEVGTALGHMTANLTRWSPEDASVFTLDIVRGMGRAAPGAAEQQVEVPPRGELGRFADAFGLAHKAFFITADSMTYDFGRLAPLDLAFIDGGHDLEHATNDSRKAYEALAPGGWLVWHDFGSPVPWVRVREAIERLGFSEPVVHVEGTEVAFLRKQAPTPSTRMIPAPTVPLRVAWEGDFEGLNSLALVNRAFARELLARGHNLGPIPDVAGPGGDAGSKVTLEPSLAARLGRGPEGGPAQVHVRHRWPPRLDPPPHGRWVLMQPWEFGSLPRAWLPMLRRVDEVWAYSRSVRDAYLEAGVPPDRVQVVPLGVDPAVFRPGVAPIPLPPGPNVRLLFVGGTIFRKGIDVLLAAYERAFRPADGVGLVIKDMGSRSFYRGQTAEARVQELRGRGYPVEYIDRDLSEEEMAGLYAACDSLVHPFRGEGFALPVVEAMACGLPVIVTGAGPVLDYATEETAYLIPARRGHFDESRVGDLETIGRPWLHEPNQDALVELLRRVAGDPSAARAKGAAASTWIREHFTWAHAADAVEARLSHLSVVRGPLSVVDPGGARASMTQPSGPGSSRAASPVDGRSAQGRRARVSLTMIVRDEEENLPHCLESVQGIFDEIVVVDTGSLDRTREIARQFGARVFEFTWIDDFAAARNASLGHATGDYAFWLDADDVIEPPQRDKLMALLDGLNPEERPSRPVPASSADPALAGYVVRCACDAGADGSGGQTVVDHIRLFPLLPGVRWTYRVHEQILPSLRRAGVPVRWTDLVVRHTGYVDVALRTQKLERDARILRQELEERPDEPFLLFNLGSIAIERRDWSGALGYLRRSLERSAPGDSITRKLFALIARAHQMADDTPAALRTCAEGLTLDPQDAELWFRKAVLHRNRGERAEAEACWRRILGLKRPDKFASVDMGIYGHLTRRNLAALAAERGDHAEAERLWREVLAECPGDRDALSHLCAPTVVVSTR